MCKGDQIDTPPNVTYASVVTRESIRIGFMLASLNELKILSADVAGAYLNAPCAEKVYTILGEEFGYYSGRKAIIRMALYGLKSAGYSWRSFCARVLREELNFIPCRAYESGVVQRKREMGHDITNICSCIQMISLRYQKIQNEYWTK